MQETPIKSNEICSLTMVRRVAAMLDLETQSFKEGDILPKGWHFFMLAGETKKSELRKDGFPGLGVPIPDLAGSASRLPRLLLGGRTVAYNEEIVIGSVIEKSSFIKSIIEKTTKNGRMAIVTLQHGLRSIDAYTPAIVETQTYILLEEQKSQSKVVAETTENLLPISSIQKQYIPDETLIFQYSALGFNSHKIHLDRNYTQQVEGLPDLVVNGGLSTLLLTEWIRTELNLNLNTIKVRHVAPLYCNRTLTMTAEQDENNWQLKIYDNNNTIAVEMEATIKE
jgi:3-methylfumaryl-CoA hydratase